MRFLQVQNKLQTKPQSKVITLAKSNFWKLTRQEGMQAGSALVRSATSVTLVCPFPDARDALRCRNRGTEGRAQRGGVQDSWKEQSCASCILNMMLPMRQFLCPLGCSISVLGCTEQEETARCSGAEFIIFFRYQKSFATSSLQVFSVLPVAFLGTLILLTVANSTSVDSGQDKAW